MLTYHGVGALADIHFKSMSPNVGDRGRVFDQYPGRDANGRVAHIDRVEDRPKVQQRMMMREHPLQLWEADRSIRSLRGLGSPLALDQLEHGVQRDGTESGCGDLVDFGKNHSERMFHLARTVGHTALAGTRTDVFE